MNTGTSESSENEVVIFVPTDPWYIKRNTEISTDEINKAINETNEYYKKYGNGANAQSQANIKFEMIDEKNKILDFNNLVYIVLITIFIILIWRQMR